MTEHTVTTGFRAAALSKLLAHTPDIITERNASDAVAAVDRALESVNALTKEAGVIRGDNKTDLITSGRETVEENCKEMTIALRVRQQQDSDHGGGPPCNDTIGGIKVTVVSPTESGDATPDAETAANTKRILQYRLVTPEDDTATAQPQLISGNFEDVDAALSETILGQLLTNLTPGEITKLVQTAEPKEAALEPTPPK